MRILTIILFSLLLGACNNISERKVESCEKTIINIEAATDIYCRYTLYCSQGQLYLRDIDTCGKYHIGDKFK